MGLVAARLAAARSEAEEGTVVLDGHAIKDAEVAPRQRCWPDDKNATYCNAHMTARQIQRHCQVEGDALILLRAAIDSMKLSARAYDRILKLARTIADLAAEERIGIAHIAEAVQYRALDRKLWG
jgi:magnesium chelatase family protein